MATTNRWRCLEILACLCLILTTAVMALQPQATAMPTGCPDPPAPSGSWIDRRTDTVVVVRCNATAHRWYLVCKNGKWYGEAGTCQPHNAYSDPCLLLPETGPCRASIPSWYYNSTSGQCERFIYGGCRGNANRFTKIEECQNACRTSDKSVSQNTAADNGTCSLLPETGPCRASMPRWFYNSTSAQCQRFIYGGCKGNSNRFHKIEDCQKACKTTSLALHDRVDDSSCTDPPETGRCRAHFPRWFYNSSAEECQSFVYGGCGGNLNRYETRTDCQRACGKSQKSHGAKAKCSAQPATGMCRAAFRRWFYNVTAAECQLFIYGGCGGNSNRYLTVSECQKECGRPRPTQLSTTRRPATKEDCSAPPETGLCDASFKSWFYNMTAGQCQHFIYGGCGGNSNRFSTRHDCRKACHNFSPVRQSRINDRCRGTAEEGNCSKSLPRWFYDEDTRSCRRFVYTGCGGKSKNRFLTKNTCIRVCSHN